MSFRLVPKLVTLNDTLNGIMALNLRYFTKLSSFQGTLRIKWLKIYLNFLQQKCSPKNLVFSYI